MISKSVFTKTAPYLLGSLIGLTACSGSSPEPSEPDAGRTPRPRRDAGPIGKDAGPGAMINLKVTPTVLTLQEGEQMGTFEVTFEESPTEEISVQVTSADPERVTVSSEPLRFDPNNFTTPQTVVVITNKDDDAIDNMVGVRLTAPNVTTTTVTVTIRDSDTQEISVNTSSITLTEGGSEAFTVSLATKPLEAIEIQIQSDNSSIVTNLSSLTFTPSDYQIAQNVVVTGAIDADDQDSSGTVRLFAPGISETRIPVSVTDTSAQNILFTPSNLNLSEGETGNISVSLAQAALEEITVNINTGDPNVAVANPTSVTFPAGSMAAQTITVVAVQDNDGQDNQTALTFSAVGLTDRTANISVADDDTQAIEVIPAGSLSVIEGQVGTFAIRLALDPITPVQITLTTSNPGAGIISPSQISFNSGNYSSLQQVSFTALQDQDAQDENVLVTINSNPTGLVTPVYLGVQIEDDEVQSLVFTPANLTMDEDSTGNFLISVAYPIQNNMTVSLNSTNPALADVSPQLIFFTPATYNQPQTIAVTSYVDANASDDVAAITVTTPGLSPQTMNITVRDTISQTVIASPPNLTVNEGQTGQSLSVTLSVQPTANVQVIAASSNPSLLQLSSTILTFTPSNYATPQVINLTVPNDENISNESTNITLTSNGLPLVAVPVSIIDDDTQTIIVDPSTVSLNEGQTANLGVRLAYAPTAPTTISLTSLDPNIASISQTSMTFTASNYGTNQIVTVTAEQDADGNDETTSIQFSSSGISSIAVPVSVVDDDSQVIEVSTNQINITEGGPGQTFNVNLRYQPNTSVVVSLSSSLPSSAEVVPGQLVFSTSNYNVPQTVTVNAPQDTNPDDESALITLSSAGVTPGNVTVSVTDDDTQTIIANLGATELNEGNNTTLTVRLAFPPSNDSTVTISSANPSALGASPSSLTFTAANYAVAQSVQVTALHDPNDQDETVDITVSSLDAAPVTLQVTTRDDDRQRLVLVPNNLTFTEGESRTFSVSLYRGVTSNLTVNLASSDTQRFEITPSVLTFTPSNALIGQTVRVTAQQDTDLTSNSGTVDLSSSATPAAFPAESVFLNVTDDDTQTIQANQQTVSVQEGGTSNLGLSLAYRPAGPVTLSIESANPGVATISPSQLTFTPSNYGTTQNVVVSGVSDSNVIPGNTTITVSSSGLAPLSIGVTVPDSDTQALIVSSNVINIDESNSTNFTVNLAYEPASNVVVSLASNMPAEVQLSNTQLFFTPGNYSSPQSVTITAPADGTAINHSAQIQVNSSGVPSQNIQVSVTNTETNTLQLAPTTVNVEEGNSSSVNLFLSMDPGTTETLTLVSNDPSRVSVSPATISFNSSNYNTPQAVTISALQDTDLSDQTANIVISNTTLGNSTVTVNVTDDDVLSIVATPVTLNVNEEATASFNVRLTHQPEQSVSLSLTSANANLLGISPASLTFDSSNWDQNQAITLSANADQDLADEDTTVTISGNNLSSTNVNVHINDNDSQNIVVSTNSVSVSEGGDIQFSVNLEYEPSGTQVLNVVPANASLIGTMPTSLTFSSGNYNVPQVVTLSAAQDTNVANETTSVRVIGSGMADALVNVSIADDDTQDYVLSTSNINLNEGDTQTFTLRLSGQPVADQTVNLVTSDPGAVVVAPATLTFSASNFNVEQTITVRAIQDLDDGDEAVTVTLQSVDISNTAVNVSVTDDETQAIIADLTSVAVSEGGSAGFNIRLGAQPTANVTVTITSNDTGIISVSPSSRTFTPSNWDQDQSVTITGVEDINASEDITSVTLAANGIAATVVPVTASDNDTQTILIDRTSLDIDEGGTGQVTVRLLFAPQSTYTVNTQLDGALLTANPSSLSFTVANYSTPQTVTITGVEDSDMYNNQTTLRFTGDGVTDRVVAVSITDNDSQAITANTNSLSLTEGQSGSFSVQLQHEPFSQVTLFVSSTGSSVALPSPVRLRFSPTNWNTPQVVTVSALQDQNISNESANIIVRGSDMPNTLVAVSVTDDDTQAITAVPASLSILEGSASQLGVRLAYRPASNVTVNLNSADTSLANPQVSSLIFTPTNYSSAQYVAIGSFQDLDVVNNNTQLTLSAAGISSNVVPITIVDDDQLNLAISTGALTITEGGTSETFTVALTLQPSSTTVVNLATNVSGAVSLSDTTLSFTSSNWNTPQTVTVSPLQDVNAENERVEIVASASGLPSQTVIVDVTDDDTQAIVLSNSSLALTEGGSGNIDVSLAFAPVGTATITVTSGDLSALTTAPSILYFTPSNYNQPRTVILSSTQDSDLLNDNLDVNFTSPNIPSATTNVTITDDDTQALTLSAQSVSVTEGSESVLTVGLAYIPSTTITVSLVSSSGSVFTVAPSLLTFTPSGAGAPQNAVISGPEDTNTDNETATLSLSTSEAPDISVTVTNVDNDVQTILLSSNRVDLTEGGNGSLDVSLSHAPASPLTVNVVSADPSAIQFASASLTFTAANFDTPQTITVQSTQDTDTEDETVSLTFSATGVTDVVATANVTDDDQQNIVLSSTTLNFAEGTTAETTVNLAFAPAQPTTVSFSSSDSGAVTINPASITFTANNYNSPQSIRFTAVNDADMTDESVTITVNAPDTADRTILATVSDDDQQAIQLSASSLTAQEGSISIVGVSLQYAPAGNVTVSIANSNSAAASLSTNTLSFTPQNYSVSQDIQVTAEQDANTNDETVTLTFTEANSNASRALTVTVQDDESQSFSVGPALVVLDEGASGTFTVALAHDPAASVTVGIAVPANAAAGITPSTLTFDSNNYSTPQTVTINGLEDNDTVMELVDIDITAPNIPPASVTAQINDNDEQDLIVSDAVAIVDEGGTQTFTVRLAYAPSGTRTVNLTSSNNSINAVPQTLSFTAGNYDQAQTVTLSGNEDADTENNSAEIQVQSANLSTQRIAVTVIDDDSQAIVATPAQLSLNEGSTDTIQVSLAYLPTSDVTVAVASSLPAAASVDVSTLTFTPGNYSTPQTVTVTGVDDQDTQSVSNVSISFASTGAENAQVSVDVTDDDDQALVVSPGSLNLVENGATGQFSVSLAYQPSGPATINISAPNGLSISPQTLNFTSQTYASAQFVTVSGLNDQNLSNDTFQVSISSSVVQTDATLSVTVTDDDSQEIILSQNTFDVTEGSITPVSVSLRFAPDGTELVTITSTDTNVLDSSPRTLAFTAGNYNQPQVVNIIATEDQDLTDNMGTLVFDSPTTSTQAVSVTVRDDDEISLIVSQSSITVNEGAAGTLTARLSHQPEANITINISSVNAAIAASNVTSIVFTPQNYSTERQIEILASEDANTTDDSTSLQFSGNGISTVQVAILVADNDVLALTAAPAVLNLQENATGAQASLSLSQAPTGPLTVSISSDNPAVATVAPTSFTFTPANWTTVQNIVVTPVQDANLVDDSAIISFAATGVTTQTIRVNVEDVDVQSVVLSTSTLSLVEGGSRTFTVNLAKQPASNLALSISSADPAIASVGPQTLVFTPTDFATPKTVTVESLNDSNLVNDNTVLSVTGAQLPGSQIGITVFDDDTQNVVVSPANLSIQEGQTVQLQVSLAFEPAGNVTISGTSDLPDYLNVNPNTLTFTPQNYDTAQTVDVVSLADPNVSTDVVTVSFGSTGISAGTTELTIEDNDSQEIILSRNTISANEGTTELISVSLRYQPATSVNIAISSSESTSVEPNLTQLTFTPSNYDQAQTVTLNVLEDVDLVGETVDITFTDGAASSVATLSVTDNDTQQLVLSSSRLNIDEGASGTITVRLAHQPSTNLTVNTNIPGGLVAVNPSSLIFTPNNYDQVQTLTLDANHDADTADNTESVELSATGVNGETISVAVRDDDVQTIQVSESSLNLNEGGSGTLTVRLAFAPSAAVTVQVSSSNSSAVTAAPASLSFDASNYSTSQTVTLNAPEDTNTNDESTAVALSAAGIPQANVSVSITDNDVQSIVLDKTSVTLGEGQNDTFTVRLAFAPTTPLTVNLAVSQTQVATLSTQSLIFTESDFDTPQTVTITGAQDANLEDQNAQVQVSANGVATTNLDLTVQDDDTQTIIATPSTVSVNENGSSAITLRLAFQPSQNTTLTLTPSDSAIASVNISQLVFSAANYDQEQSVDVLGTNDADTVDGNTTVNITGGSAQSVSVPVTVVDDDTLNILLSPTNLSLTEGGSGETVNVELSAAPANNVTVNIATADAAIATASNTSLIFSPSNWNQAQTVTITPTDDNNADPENTTVTFSASGINSRSVTVDVTDDEQQSLVINASSLNVAEGASGQVIVRLAYAPANPVTVSALISDTTVASVSPANLTFNSSNFDQGQTITVSGVEDVNLVTDTTELQIQSAQTGRETITISVSDNDTLSIALSNQDLPNQEGDSGEVYVALSHAPASDVTVTVTSNDPNALSVSPAQLIFTPQNYATTQRLALLAEQDVDSMDEQVSLNLDAAGGINTSLSISIQDDDTQTILTSPDTLTINESGSAQVQIRLSAAPQNQATLSLAASISGAVQLSPSTLSFDASNYNNAQTVTVSALSDNDSRDENLTINITSPIAQNLSLPVTVEDDDEQDYVLSANSVSVEEGSSASLTLALAFEPTGGSLQVNLSSIDTNVMAVSPTNLVFTPQNYSTPQTITVSGEQDSNTSNDLTQLLIASSEVADTRVSVNVNDDDTQGLLFSPSLLALEEGESTSVSVRLAFAPVGNVSYSIVSSAPAALTLSQSTISFTPSNFDLAQSITVTANQDDDTLDANNLVLRFTSQSLGTSILQAPVTDDDKQAVVFSQTNLNLTEGATSNAVTARLAYNPVSNLTAQITSSDAAKLGVAPQTITFTSQNYASPRTLVIEAIEDNDTADEALMVIAESASLSENSTVSVDVSDNDSLDIVLSPSVVNITEGGQANVGIALSHAPAGAYTVDLASSDISSTDVSPGSVTFTPTNYDTPQTVIISALEDTDADSESVQVSATGTGLNPPSQSVSVSINDNDLLLITANPTSVSVNEGSGSQISVRLSNRPSANTTVNIAIDDTTAAAFSATSLVFTSGNYDTEQFVWVNGLNDSDTNNESATITLSASGIPNLDIPLSVVDDDALNLELSRTGITLNEGGQNQSFTISLTSQPSTSVSVSISSPSSQVVVSPSSFVIDPFSWQNPRTVTLSAGQDNNVADETVQISVSGSGGLTPQTVSVQVLDDDEQAIVSNVNSVNLNEGGTADIGISLQWQPSSNFTVNVTSENPNLVSASVPALTFTPSNYNVAQTVTLSASEDVNLINDSTRINLRANNVSELTVPVSIADNDTQAVVLTPTTLTVDEGQNTSFTVRLAYAPTADITTLISALEPNLISVTPAQFTFNLGNYDQAQVITVTAQQDNNTRNEVTDINLTTPGLQDETITVNLQDDDQQAIMVSPSSASIDEGSNGVFEVRLAYEPQQIVLVNLSNPSPNRLSVNQTQLSFSANDWSSPQLVNMSAAQDPDAEDNSIDLSFTSSGLPTVTRTVNISDNDTQSLVLASDRIEIAEGGQTAISVNLSHPPSNPVTVAFASNSGSAILASSTLSFNSSNFDTPQSIIVSSPQDSDLADETASISITSPGITSRTVSVLVVDNDSQELVVSPSNVSVTEGGTTDVTVQLQYQPFSATTVTLSLQDATVASVSSNTLTFTPANYDTPQTVSILGAEDANTTSESTNLTISATTADSLSLTIDVVDNDTQTIVLDQTTLTVTEGQTGAVAVTLSHEPLTPLTVSIASSNLNILRPSPVALTFTSTSYQIAQTVNLIAQEDVNLADETTQLTFSANGVTSQNMDVSIEDDDTQVIITDPNSLMVNEGANGTINVQLRNQPSGTESVNLSLSNSKFSVTPSSLSFSQTNYNTSQAVTLTANQDSDIVNDSAVLSLNTSGNESTTVTLTNLDDDSLNIVATPSTLTLTEGGSTTLLALSLSQQPSSDVTVSIAAQDSGVVVVFPSSRVFNASNWNTPFNVQVLPVDDADANDESTNLSFSASGLNTRNVPVTVTDDDVMAIVVSGSNISVDEGGTTQLDVQLSNAPASTVRVDLANNAPNAFSVSRAYLDFDASNYDTPQTVTITGRQDANLADESGTLDFVSAGLSTFRTTINVSDDDTQNLIVSNTSFVIEEGQSGEFRVRLEYEPANNVTVSLSNSAPGTIGLASTSLTFTPANYNQDQAVQFTATHDNDLTDDNATVTVSATGISGSTAINFSIEDDDVQRIVTSRATLAVDEGSQEVFTIRLAQEPSSLVTVTVVNPNSNAIDINPATLFFNSSNYSTAQSVGVSALQDLNTDSETIDVNITSSGISAQTVRITTNDDDDQRIVLSRTSIDVDEGSTQTFLVSLLYQPTADVTVNLASDSPSVANLSASNLTFTASNFNTAQSVTVTAPQDNDTRNDIANISLSGTGLPNANIPVLVTDDDFQSMILNQYDFDIDEGNTGDLTVSLSYDPVTPVTINLNSMDIGAVSLTPSQLVFDSSNYGTPQNVVITGIQDNDTEDELDIFVELLAAGIQTEEIVVNIIDEDVQAIVVTPSTLTVNEDGSSEQFLVSLAFDPGSTVQVAVANSNASAATIDRTQLTFNSQNYANGQAITVTAVSDTNTDDEATTFTVSSAAISNAPSVTCTIADDDVQTFVLSSRALLVEENDQTTMTVALAYAPSSPVSVSVTSDTPNKVTVSPSTINFNGSNFATPITISINALGDTDADDESVRVSLSASGIDTADVSVSVSDTNQLEILPSTDHGLVAEGAATSFTISLGAAPPGVQEIAITSRNLSKAIASPATLTFDPSNFQTPQTVSFISQQDPDPTDDIVMFDITSPGLASLEYELTIQDDDSLGLIVSQSTLSLTEGSSDTVTVSLNAAPQISIPVSVSSSFPSSITVTPSELTFVPGGPTTQTITIAALEDLDPVNQAALITATSTLTTPGSVEIAVSTFDNDTINAVFNDTDVTQTYVRTMSTPTDHTIIQVHVISTIYLAAATGAPAIGTCNSADTVMRLFDMSGNEIGMDDNDGVNNCSSFVPGVDSFVLLDGGDYYLTVEENGQDAVIPNYQLRLVASPANVCGNGFVEAGETCDDGNVLSNDGCSDSCQAEYALAVVTPSAITLHQITESTQQAPPAYQTISVSASGEPSWAPSGSHIAVSNGSGSVLLLDTGTAQQTASFSGNNPQYSPDGSEIIAADSSQNCFRIYDVSMGTHSCVNDSGVVNRATWDPTGTDRWAFLGAQNALIIRNRANTERLVIATNVGDFGWAQTGNALIFVQPDSSGSNCKLSRAALGAGGSSATRDIVSGIDCGAKIHEVTDQDAVFVGMLDSSGHFLYIYRFPTNSPTPIAIGPSYQLNASSGTAEQWARTSDGALMGLLVSDGSGFVSTFPSTLNSSGGINTIYSPGVSVSGISFRD